MPFLIKIHLKATIPNQIRELTQDNSEDNKIIYGVYGKVIEVTTVANVTKAKYFYDGGGQRVKKETYNGTTVKTTWYIEGHIYERTGTSGELLHTEITISGGGRLGVAYTNVYNNSLDYHYELSDHLGNPREIGGRLSERSYARLHRVAQTQ